jgi:hypothetical protein
MENSAVYGEIWANMQTFVSCGKAVETLALVGELTRESPDANFWAAVREYLIGAIEYTPETPVAQSAPAKPVSAQTIPNEYYTIELTGPDDYVTLRVADHFDEQKAAKGDKMVGYLAGPDNTTDYVNFGFIVGGRFFIWKKNAGLFPRQHEAAQKLVTANLEDAGMLYALKSSRCRRCGRVLTVDASKHRGYGPDCATMIGG